MSFRVVDIDHLMIRVAKLDAGVETFEALGFTVAPPRRLVDMSALERAVGDSGGHRRQVDDQQPPHPVPGVPGT
jgi:hypothetical protein